MKYPTRGNLLHHYCWLFILLTYSNCTPTEVLRHDLTEPLLYKTSGPSRTPCAACRKDNLLVGLEVYCKNVYSAAKVEQLLHWDTNFQHYFENWWRRTDYVFLLLKISDPICATAPNAETLTVDEISDHEFFQTRNIHVPVMLGKAGKRLNQYEHLNREPVWRTMLECDCAVTGDDTNNDICVDGKIVNLSRGVGGDKSFFVHALNSSGSYKVIAHICFK